MKKQSRELAKAGNVVHHYWALPGIKRRERDLAVEEVLKTVSEFSGRQVAWIRKAKKDEAARWRFCCYYLLDKYTKMKHHEIAEEFPNIGRITVTYGIKQVRKAMLWNEEIDKYSPSPVELRDCVEFVEHRLFGDGRDIFRELREKSGLTVREAQKFV